MSIFSQVYVPDFLNTIETSPDGFRWSSWVQQFMVVILSAISWQIKAIVSFVDTRMFISAIIFII